MKRIPVVTIVGRMNVGKSTLFNRLTPSVKSMALDHRGVTRDVLRDTVAWAGKQFELVDTGGLDFRKSTDSIRQKVQEKAMEAVQEADVLLFVVDGTTGSVPDDWMIMRHLHACKRPIVVAVNKADVAGVIDEARYDFHSLGGSEVVSVSAEHARGIEDVLEAVLRYLPERGVQEEVEPVFRVMFLGRPNVGKSSLMNQLVKYERAIVSEQPGTTREAVSERIVMSKEHIILTDTPGLRRQSTIHESLEEEMVHRSLQALEASDIVLLLIDGTEGTVVDQELKLGFYAFTERYKALILVVNKADLMTDEQRKGLEHTLELYQHLMRKIPMLTLSCKSGKNVGKVLPLVREVWQHHSMRIPHAELQNYLISELLRKPLMRNGQKLAMYYAAQVATAPITIAMRVNEPAWFGPSQLAFFENLMRNKYNLRGAPVKFIVRKERID